ncbi:hypothetical protein FISHEDRAFT_59766 [Fistulina hepatica ATCC 64428]|uniref:Uncharacterized protein n=1 Tax=Fistulina hepatica ATCC 64428 TaxID=1128425 RepID=A0A0D7A8Z2_9AGAR|nr:hypothetical protein FISHEDRAFT_59766 [Fistulina hepatica ATCC 64428]
MSSQSRTTNVPTPRLSYYDFLNEPAPAFGGLEEGGSSKLSADFSYPRSSTKLFAEQYLSGLTLAKKRVNYDELCGDTDLYKRYQESTKAQIMKNGIPSKRLMCYLPENEADIAMAMVQQIFEPVIIMADILGWTPKETEIVSLECHAELYARDRLPEVPPTSPGEYQQYTGSVGAALNRETVISTVSIQIDSAPSEVRAQGQDTTIFQTVDGDRDDPIFKRRWKSSNTRVDYVFAYYCPLGLLPKTNSTRVACLESYRKLLAGKTRNAKRAENQMQKAIAARDERYMDQGQIWTNLDDTDEFVKAALPFELKARLRHGLISPASIKKFASKNVDLSGKGRYKDGTNEDKPVLALIHQMVRYAYNYGTPYIIGTDYQSWALILKKPENGWLTDANMEDDTNPEISWSLVEREHIKDAIAFMTFVTCAKIEVPPKSDPRTQDAWVPSGAGSLVHWFADRIFLALKQYNHNSEVYQAIARRRK